MFWKIDFITSDDFPKLNDTCEKELLLLQSQQRFRKS